MGFYSKRANNAFHRSQPKETEDDSGNHVVCIIKWLLQVHAVKLKKYAKLLLHGDSPYLQTAHTSRVSPKFLNVLKCDTSTSYGADHRTPLLLYRAIPLYRLIEARLHIFCVQLRESSKKTVNAVYHAALRIVTGAFRSSPKSSLLSG